MKKTAIGLGLFLVTAALMGCQDDPLKKVQVHGKVTFEGKACPAPGRITFSPIEIGDGLPRRPASGKFETDGLYEAFSFRPGDGVVPGKYKVVVGCYEGSMLHGAPSDDDYRAASYVADEFEAQEIVIAAGSKPIEFNIDVPLRTPKK